ncbi:MAG TPA: peptide chain release factor N(5)-glutamine methyltransferase [Candidatus Acidoferrum sp.]|nr:peptide chain release factor N(5)-glutamine methyltransferase [Candidatus Acidoferrum sp.]
MSIQDWLDDATKQLRAAGVLSARLDSLLLLADELARDKTWLLAHAKAALSTSQLQELDQKLIRRIKREPLAYIRGTQEFYRREFIVTPDVLIPRPETETLIELLAGLSKKSGDTLVDIGTGSGCIAITAKLEMPELSVYASDISQPALAIAKQNAARLGAAITFYQQNLLVNKSHGPFSFIIANLPYVAKKWERSPETNFEPAHALFAPDQGLQFINQLLSQSSSQLVQQGYLLLEADPRQHQTIIKNVANIYKVTRQQGFALVLQRQA